MAQIIPLISYGLCSYFKIFETSVVSSRYGKRKGEECRPSGHSGCKEQNARQGAQTGAAGAPVG